MAKKAPVPAPAPAAVISVTINPPNFKTAKVRAIGTAPYLGNKFGPNKLKDWGDKQDEGSATGRKRRAKPPRNVAAALEDATHFSEENWPGIPASSIRNALISACRTVEFAMTRAKLCLFVDADGIDRDSGQPLLRIHGKSEMLEMPVKIGMTTGIAVRPMWRQWYVDLTLRWDADQFTAADVMNLLARAGAQVGIGAGRPDSKTSAGIGMGTFRVEA